VGPRAGLDATEKKEFELRIPGLLVHSVFTILSSGVWRCIDWQVFTDVSEERAVGRGTCYGTVVPTRIYLSSTP
jgi:hypothetical protein